MPSPVDLPNPGIKLGLLNCRQIFLPTELRLYKFYQNIYLNIFIYSPKYIYINIFIYIYTNIFLFIGNYKILNTVACAMQ